MNVYDFINYDNKKKIDQCIRLCKKGYISPKRIRTLLAQLYGEHIKEYRIKLYLKRLCKEGKIFKAEGISHLRKYSLKRIKHEKDRKFRRLKDLNTGSICERIYTKGHN